MYKRQDLIPVIAVHQADVIFRIEKGLVVVLTMDVGQLVTSLWQFTQGDQLAVKPAEILAGGRDLSSDDDIFSEMCIRDSS